MAIPSTQTTNFIKVGPYKFRGPTDIIAKIIAAVKASEMQSPPVLISAYRDTKSRAFTSRNIKIGNQSLFEDACYHITLCPTADGLKVANATRKTFVLDDPEEDTSVWEWAESYPISITKECKTTACDLIRSLNSPLDSTLSISPHAILDADKKPIVLDATQKELASKFPDEGVMLTFKASRYSYAPAIKKNRIRAKVGDFGPFQIVLGRNTQGPFVKCVLKGNSTPINSLYSRQVAQTVKDLIKKEHLLSFSKIKISRTGIRANDCLSINLSPAIMTQIKSLFEAKRLPPNGVTVIIDYKPHQFFYALNNDLPSEQEPQIKPGSSASSPTPETTLGFKDENN